MTSLIILYITTIKNKEEYEENKLNSAMPVLKICKDFNSLQYDFVLDADTSYLDFLWRIKSTFIIGITNRVDTSDFKNHVHYKINPLLISFGVLEIDNNK